MIKTELYIFNRNIFISYMYNFHINLNVLTVTIVRSTRLFLDTSLLSGTIGLLTVAVVVNKSLIGCTT